MRQLPNRCRRVLAGLLLVALAAVEAFAQATEGSLRGYIRDEQGAPMPGVTVTAKSTAATRPLVAVTDETGAYRLLNVPPGDYSVSAELSGFSTSVRENIIGRRRPEPRHRLHADGRRARRKRQGDGRQPAARSHRRDAGGERQWRDAADDSARRPAALVGVPAARARRGVARFHGEPGATFYVHGAGIVSFSTLVDGADMTSAVNPWQAYSALPDETAADVQIKTNGFDAATPLGMAVASNLVLKSGTNALTRQRHVRLHQQGLDRPQHHGHAPNTCR